MKWEKRRFFVYRAASPFHVISKEVENRIFRYNNIFRHTCIDKQPIFVQIFFSYLRYTDRLFDALFLLLAVILSEFHEKPRRKYWVIDRSTLKNLCETHHFFGCMPSLLCRFLSLFWSIPNLQRKKKDFTEKWFYKEKKGKWWEGGLAPLPLGRGPGTPCPPVSTALDTNLKSNNMKIEIRNKNKRTYNIHINI